MDIASARTPLSAAASQRAPVPKKKKKTPTQERHERVISLLKNKYDDNTKTVQGTASKAGKYTDTNPTAGTNTKPKPKPKSKPKSKPRPKPKLKKLIDIMLQINLKAVVRFLPPALEEADFYSAVRNYVNEKTTVESYYVQGEYLSNQFQLPISSRAYVLFKEQKYMDQFISFVNNKVFKNSKDVRPEESFTLLLEVAFFDKMTSNLRLDQLAGPGSSDANSAKETSPAAKTSLQDLHQFKRFCKWYNDEDSGEGNGDAATLKNLPKLQEIDELPIFLNSNFISKVTKKSGKVGKSGKSSGVDKKANKSSVPHEKAGHSKDGIPEKGAKDKKKSKKKAHTLKKTSETPSDRPPQKDAAAKKDPKSKTKKAERKPEKKKKENGAKVPLLGQDGREPVKPKSKRKPKKEGESAKRVLNSAPGSLPTSILAKS